MQTQHFTKFTNEKFIAHCVANGYNAKLAAFYLDEVSDFANNSNKPSDSLKTTFEDFTVYADNVREMDSDDLIACFGENYAEYIA